MIRSGVVPSLRGVARGIARSGNSGGALHADTIAYMARVTAAGGSLTNAQLAAADYGAVAINAAGLKTKCKRLSWFLGTTSAAALIPLYNTWGAAADSLTSAPTYSATRGFTGDGTDDEVKTGLTPSSASGYTVLDASWFAYLTTGNATGANRYWIGCVSNSGTLRTASRWATSNTLFFWNGPTAEIALSGAGFTEGSMSGWLGVSNVAGPVSKCWRNGTALQTDSAFSTNSPTAAEFKILTASGGGEWSNCTAAGYMVGTGLSDSEQETMRQIFEEVAARCGRMDQVAAFGDSNIATGSGDVLTYLMSTNIPRTSSFNGGVGGETAAQTTGRMTTNYASATSCRRWNQLLWSGRNTFGSGGTFTMAQAEALLAEYQAQVALIGHTRYRILQPLPMENSAEYIGGAKRAAMQYVWDGMASLFGPRYIELLTTLQSNGNGDANDNLDISRGIVPRSLRADDTHLTIGVGGAQNVIVRPLVVTSISGGW